MFVVYIICKMIVDLVFIAMSLYLSFKTNNFSYLWFLVVPIISHLCTSVRKSDEKDLKCSSSISWTKTTDKLPDKNLHGKVLVAYSLKAFPSHILYTLCSYTTDLATIDGGRFSDRVGVPGFYVLEYGEYKEINPKYWMEIPDVN